MNLEVNLNLTLSKVVEEGRTLVPLFGPGFTGLQNLGNSCYMNSIIQIFFSIDEFKKRYLEDSIEHIENCMKNANECFACQVIKVAHGIWSGDYSIKKKAEKIQFEG
jgi:ubiquitin carboxyl-terminal hydrolase 5/13